MRERLSLGLYGDRGQGEIWDLYGNGWMIIKFAGIHVVKAWVIWEKGTCQSLQIVKNAKILSKDGDDFLDLCLQFLVDLPASLFLLFGDIPVPNRVDPLQEMGVDFVDKIAVSSVHGQSEGVEVGGVFVQQPPDFLLQIHPMLIVVVAHWAEQRRFWNIRRSKVRKSFFKSWTSHMYSKVYEVRWLCKWG